MREIMFRGKRIDTGEWAFGFLDKRPSPIQIGDGSPWIIHTPPVDPDDEGGLYNVQPETVGQFTGFRDSAKNRIFDGDVLHFSETSFPDGEILPAWNALVLWADGGWVLRHKKAESGFLDVLEEDVAQEATIAGNIYDNPQLMEVTDDGI